MSPKPTSSKARAKDKAIAKHKGNTKSGSSSPLDIPTIQSRSMNGFTSFDSNYMPAYGDFDFEHDVFHNSGHTSPTMSGIPAFIKKETHYNGSDSESEDGEYQDVSATPTLKTRKNGTPRKARKARKKLLKWDDYDWKKGMLAIVWACGEAGLDIPFRQAAQQVDDGCTAGAFQQAILKLREKMNADGAQMPVLKMAWTRNKVSSSTNTEQSTFKRNTLPRRKPTSMAGTQVNMVRLKQPFIEKVNPRPFSSDDQIKPDAYSHGMVSTGVGNDGTDDIDAESHLHTTLDMRPQDPVFTSTTRPLKSESPCPKPGLAQPLADKLEHMVGSAEQSEPQGIWEVGPINSPERGFEPQRPQFWWALPMSPYPMSPESHDRYFNQIGPVTNNFGKSSAPGYSLPSAHGYHHTGDFVDLQAASDLQKQPNDRAWVEESHKAHQDSCSYTAHDGNGYFDPGESASLVSDSLHQIGMDEPNQSPSSPSSLGERVYTPPASQEMSSPLAHSDNGQGGLAMNQGLSYQDQFGWNVNEQITGFSDGDDLLTGTGSWAHAPIGHASSFHHQQSASYPDIFFGESEYEHSAYMHGLGQLDSSRLCQ
ncbi:hypothetical protein K504DRAFT_22461 [Pleomassaria siparia CBS 279.74]|uniref:Uncharacterized protein n=1 Tax=Pleomassaria siparia CBS 279.74 TaxID=1314801 RepID=A0A6G1KQQ7_9PLEO|nr:hypothetical protein K504DRAFT_22461 [Pleomassaria siparia CBS 279.74]